MMLRVKILDEVRIWVLSRDSRERAIYIFAWACGVCSAAGVSMQELSERLVGPNPGSGEGPR